MEWKGMVWYGKVVSTLPYYSVGYQWKRLGVFWDPGDRQELSPIRRVLDSSGKSTWTWRPKEDQIMI